jgi:hypothetical protein
MSSSANQNKRAQTIQQQEFHVLTDGLYIGLLKDGLMDGYGTKLWMNIAGLELPVDYTLTPPAEFIKNVFAGKFGYVKAKYCGDWKEGEMHGLGKYEWMRSGNVYYGKWNQGKMHGEGTFKWSNGKCYEGDWENGNMHGVGCMKYPGGGCYRGSWKNDKKHGKGAEYLNGACLHGIWRDNKYYIDAFAESLPERPDSGVDTPLGRDLKWEKSARTWRMKYYRHHHHEFLHWSLQLQC